MKLKIIAVVFISLLIYSCASKSVVPVVASNKVELKPEIVLETKNTVMIEALFNGKTLFENKCGNCHSLYKPEDFTSEQWKPILVRMQNQAHLDEAQIESISNYINSQL